MACDKSSAETIEILTERLQASTLLEDRRDASRGLKALAKFYRVEVGAQAMEPLLQAIRNDKHDTELANNCLDSLNYIISGDFGDSPAATWEDTEDTTSHDPGQELAEIFLKRPENVTTVLDAIVANEFNTRWVGVRLLYGLARRKLDMVQDAILSFPLGIPHLIELLNEEQELIRNDALVLFVRLTQGNRNIQNIFAFENCFDKIMCIIRLEGYLEGTAAVVMDCLKITLNLLLANESNQVLFREASHIQKLISFFDVEVQNMRWTKMNTTCLILALQIIDTMISPQNAPAHRQACQSLMQQCGLFDLVCGFLVDTEMPYSLVFKVMHTAADMVGGGAQQQHQNSTIEDRLIRTSTIIPVLLLSAIKEMSQ